MIQTNLRRMGCTADPPWPAALPLFQNSTVLPDNPKYRETLTLQRRTVPKFITNNYK
jgi:hypothetical protein